MKNLIRTFLTSVAALGLAAVSSSASADDTVDLTKEPSTHAGRAAVYATGDLSTNNSLETVSTPAAIKAMFNKDGKPNVAPTAIWKVLEHGEKMECLACIPLVEGLLYDTQHAKSREIAAWWLRRRIFGVFGKGEVYSRVIDKIADQSQPPEVRAAAANALGEFLTFSGREPLSTAIRSDGSAMVRQAAVQALERMNSDGANGEISFAMQDGDVSVRLAAVHAATRVNMFADSKSIAALVGDEDAKVRQAAAAALGTMRVKDAVDGLILLASSENEPDAAVRKSAVWSLGQIRDSAANDVVRSALHDPDAFVRDAARIAALRLGI